MKSRRVLLKLSGEALFDMAKHTYDDKVISDVAKQVSKAHKDGIQIGIVIGGGNYWRGRSSKDMDRVKADQIGMLATVMNCVYVSESFRNAGLKTIVMSPFKIGTITKEFAKDDCLTFMEAGYVVFFAGGTGHPYFSTDTGTVLRAIEIEADHILLAKSIDGIYDSDPKVNKKAKKYKTITIKEVISKELQVIDMTASVMCEENHMPLMVFDLKKKNAIYDAMQGKAVGTIVNA